MRIQTFTKECQAHALLMKGDKIIMTIRLPLRLRFLRPNNLFSILHVIVYCVLGVPILGCQYCQSACCKIQQSEAPHSTALEKLDFVMDSHYELIKNKNDDDDELLAEVQHEYFRIIGEIDYLNLRSQEAIQNYGDER